MREDSIKYLNHFTGTVVETKEAKLPNSNVTNSAIAPLYYSSANVQTLEFVSQKTILGVSKRYNVLGGTYRH